MVAKMLLPLLGGTPAVWNTCMVFFQAVLLAGYAYALVVSKWQLPKQLAFQILLLVLAFVSLPIGLSQTWVNSVPATSNPSVWLLTCLAAIVGLPFFVISSNGPLLQKWFSSTALSGAADPYFLYATSNAGSLLALLAYPAVLEPNLTLQLQSRVWAVGYSLLLLLVALCGISAWRLNRRLIESAPADESTTAQPVPRVVDEDSPGPSVRQRLRWILLALVPSSLMLGVTHYLATDIASVPLLWVIPLALYLLTLVLAFARRQLIPSRVLALTLPGVTVLFLFVYLSGIAVEPWLMIVFSLSYFFLAALTCHTQLAADRPSTKYLPEFYFWLSLGGVLGGIFNALIAPLVFNAIIEYPLMVLLACLFLPSPSEKSGSRRLRWMDYLLPLAILVLTFALGLVLNRLAPGTFVAVLIVLGVPLILSYPARRRPLRFVLCLTALIAGATSFIVNNRTLHAERNFFGVLRVTSNRDDTMRAFFHGSTIHGREFTSPEHRCEPLSYFHREGPLGEVFAAFRASPAVREVAIVGLGVGATASYAMPNERWTFYEIDPAVVSISSNPAYFSYVTGCMQVPFNVVLGDARLKLRNAPDSGYGLIVMDAFSSDVVPVHLITQQALDLYLSKLAPGGLLAFNISNRNLDLSPVVADLALSRNLSCNILEDRALRPIEGKDSSVWVVMARNAADTSMVSNSSFARSATGDRRHLWTDDFSNILSVFRWH